MKKRRRRFWVGLQARWRERATAWDRRRILLSAVIGISVALGTIGAGFWLSRSSDDQAVPRTAVIVDQLSLTQPNPRFVSQATNQLQAAGYRVDYVPGELVTVGYYRTLPAKRYALIIFRTHAATFKQADASHRFALLFTSERFDATQHTDELRNGRLGEAIYNEGAAPLFAITPEFLRHANGSFRRSTIVMMGCNGLQYEGTAQAFLDRGATAFVSWDKQVTPEHTDLATQRLLAHLLVDGDTFRTAVSATNSESGPDPSFGATLAVVGQTDQRLTASRNVDGG